MTRRRERINELLRKEISEVLRREVNDPRLKQFITVTEVSISPDLKRAKVFISVMGTDEEWAQALKGLVAASGFLRRELGERLSLRYTPELSFERDKSIEQGSRLLGLIKAVAPGDPPDEADSS